MSRESKGTDKFKIAIQEHLNYRGFEDPLFAETLKKPNKSIDECIKYILGQVQKSGANGFEDDEIFNMAVHYYDEDKLNADSSLQNMHVVVNHKVELTDKEIAEAKQKAIDDVISEQREKMLKKPKKKVAVNNPLKKEEDKPNVGDSAIGTLF